MTDLNVKYDKILREALDDLWAKLQGSVNMAAIERLLLQGDLQGVFDMLRVVEPAIYATMAPVLEDAVLESGRLVAEILPSGAVVSPIVVSLTDPRAAAYVQRYVADRVVEISTETVEAVRQAVLFGVNTGRPPAAVARDFKSTIGLNTKQELAVRNFRTALETDPAKAMGYELRDKRYDGLLEADKPLNAKQIDAMVTRYRSGQLRYRTEAISRTESMTAISVGQEEAIRQGVNSGAIQTVNRDGRELRGFWVATHDGRTRHAHLAIPGMNPKGVPIGVAFKTPLGSMMMPRDPDGTAANTIQCRCRKRWSWITV